MTVLAPDNVVILASYELCQKSQKLPTARLSLRDIYDLAACRRALKFLD